jgi:hypothetical protein
MGSFFLEIAFGHFGVNGQKDHFSKNRNKNPKNELPSDFIFVSNRVICAQKEMVHATSKSNPPITIFDF